MNNNFDNCTKASGKTSVLQQSQTTDKMPEAAGGMLAGGSLCREGLLGRIRGQRERAENEGRRARNLRQLESLLEKNPDTARILDLLEEVRL